MIGDTQIKQTNRLQLPPSSGSAPPGRIAGGSRDDCPLASLPITALVPDAHQWGGYTTNARPTIWIYLPYLLNVVSSEPNTNGVESLNSARLEIDGTAGELEGYQTVLGGDLTESGIIGLTLPETVPELAVGDELRWTVLFYCGDRQYSGRPVTVSGWITRVEPDSVTAETMIWYDRLTEAANALRDDPDNPDNQQQWAELMQQVEVDGIGAVPIQDCCTLERPD